MNMTIMGMKMLIINVCNLHLGLTFTDLSPLRLLASCVRSWMTRDQDYDEYIDWIATHALLAVVNSTTCAKASRGSDESKKPMICWS